MSKIRRWLGRYLALAAVVTLAACGAMTPSLTPGLQSVSPSADTSAQPTQDPVGALIDLLPQPAVSMAPEPVDGNAHDASLVHALAERFHRPETLIQRVVTAANKFAHEGFPTRDDLLAIIAVESSFNPRASYKGSKGLMQVQMASHRNDLAGKHPYSIEDNVSTGSDILYGYYLELNCNRRSAVLAYNAGIGSFLKHHYKVAYYRKYLAELQFIRSIQA